MKANSARYYYAIKLFVPRLHVAFLSGLQYASYSAIGGVLGTSVGEGGPKRFVDVVGLLGHAGDAILDS